MSKSLIREALVFEIEFQKGRNNRIDESEFDTVPWICFYMYEGAWISMEMPLSSKDIHGHQ